MEFLSFYYGENFPEKFTKEEQYTLINLAQHGDDDARNRLVESCIKFIFKCAKSYNRPGTDIDDLFQEGIIGCIKAISAFKTDKNYAFSTFANIVINNQIKTYIRSLKLVNYPSLSLDQPIYESSDGEELYLSDFIEDDIIEHNPENYTMINTMREIVLLEFNKLIERDKMLLEYKFGLNGNPKLNQTQIAKICGYSRTYICKLISSSLTMLRKNIEYRLNYEEDVVC